jgi:hypothetical protein
MADRAVPFGLRSVGRRGRRPADAAAVLVSRSADSVDVLASLDLPLTTSAPSTPTGRGLDPVTGQSRLHLRVDPRYRGAGRPRRDGRMCRRPWRLGHLRGGPRPPGRRHADRPLLSDAGQEARCRRAPARRTPASRRARLRGTALAVRCGGQRRHVSTLPRGRVMSTRAPGGRARSATAANSAGCRAAGRRVARFSPALTTALRRPAHVRGMMTSNAGPADLVRELRATARSFTTVYETLDVLLNPGR